MYFITPFIGNGMTLLEFSGKEFHINDLAVFEKELNKQTAECVLYNIRCKVEGKILISFKNWTLEAVTVSTSQHYTAYSCCNKQWYYYDNQRNPPVVQHHSLSIRRSEDTILFYVRK